MNIVGDGHIKFYGPEDEVPHPIGTSEWWNESVWLHFLDARSGVNGIMRIGHEPNWQGGSTAIWTLVQTPNWLYKKDGLYPLRDGDRPANGFKSHGTHSFTFDGKDCCWTVNDGDFEAKLRIEDYHAPLSFWPKGSEMESIAPNHTEGPGKVSGAIVIKGEEFKLTDALGYRDHSWGDRFWNDLRAHRWVGTNFGPDFNCNAIIWLNHHNDLGRYGYVRRGDTIYVASEVDIITHMEPDGITHRGGVCRYLLPTGEKIEIHCTPAHKALISRHHTLALNDTICVAKYGDGVDQRVGATCFESNNNLQAGAMVPLQKGVVRGVVDNGIWPVTLVPSSFSL